MIAVEGNMIGIEGAQALAGALKINKSLVDVSLDRKSAHRTVSFVAKYELILVLLGQITKLTTPVPQHWRKR